jgi:drug/metabolite transporter (DMT)-like permease
MRYCLLSALGFGAMAIFAKYAYGDGVNLVTLLAVRFTIAAVALWLLARARGAIGTPRALLAGALLGLCGYAVEAGLFFGALTRIDASLASLVLYVYPALVLAGAVALGRDYIDGRRAAALFVSLAGVALVLAGGDPGRFDGVGVLMALAAAVGYSAYVLGSDKAAEGTTPLAFAAAVCTGAANAFLLAGLVLGELDFTFEPTGWLWIGALALVSTVLAITAFLEGMQRVGPGKAAIVSTVEPPFTVALAALCFGERLAPVQLLGGALVLAGVVVLQTQRSSASSAASAPADSPVAATSSRQSESVPPASSHARVSSTVSTSGRTLTSAETA